MAAQYPSDESSDSSEHVDRDSNRCGVVMEVFQSMMDTLKKEVDDLEKRTHPEYVRRIKKLETERNERLRLNDINRSYLEERADRDFDNAIKAAQEEFDKKQNDLMNKLVAECEERRKLVEHEHQTMKLVDDEVEVAPARPRISQRIAKIPVCPKTKLPPSRRRGRAFAKRILPKMLPLMLKDEEIEDDLRTITSGMTAGGSSSPSVSTDVNDDDMSSDVLIMWPTDAQMLAKTKIVDGKLFYDGSWYHLNETVYVEGSDMPMFGALITAIGVETVWVKNKDNNSKVKILVSHLIQGKVSIKRTSSKSSNFLKYV